PDLLRRVLDEVVPPRGLDARPFADLLLLVVEHRRREPQDLQRVAAPGFQLRLDDLPECAAPLAELVAALAVLLADEALPARDGAVFGRELALRGPRHRRLGEGPHGGGDS